MNSDLRALIFSFTPVAQLQMWDPRLRIAITEAPTLKRFLASQQLPASPLFSYANFRNIILARYSGPEVSQVLAYYDEEANIAVDGDIKILPIESFTHIAMAHGELGFFGHWHFSITSCLLLAVRNRDYKLMEYYMQFALFGEEDGFYVQVVVREAVSMDDVRMVALLLKLKIYGLFLSDVKPKSIAMLELLLQYSPDRNMLYLVGYAKGKGWKIKDDLLKPRMVNAGFRGYQHASYLGSENDAAVGQWIAGLRTLPEKEEILDYLVNWAILNLDSDIFPVLIAAKRTPFTLTEGFLGHEASASKIITKAMVENIDKHVENILEFVTETEERKLVLTYCNIIARKVVAVDRVNYHPDVNTAYDELFDALGLRKYEDRFSSTISEVMFGDEAKRDFNFIFANEPMKLLSHGEDKFIEALSEPRFDGIENIDELDPMFMMTILSRVEDDDHIEDDIPTYLCRLPRTWFLAEQFINLFPDRDGSHLDSKSVHSSADITVPKTMKEALIEAKDEIVGKEQKQKVEVEEMVKLAKERRMNVK